MLNKRPEKRTKWTYDGHSGETADVKAAKKKTREDADYRCKYVRGLRVYIQDCTTTKFIDRDACGSLNIGIIWLSDHVAMQVRPAAFVRPKKGKAKLATVSGTSASGPTLLPAQNSIEKDHTAASMTVGHQVVGGRVSRSELPLL